MKKSYDPNLQIENLFEQANDAVEYVAAGNTPYTPLQIVMTAYQLVFNAGVFGIECKNGGKYPCRQKMDEIHHLLHRETHGLAQIKSTIRWSSIPASSKLCLVPVIDCRRHCMSRHGNS